MTSCECQICFRPKGERMIDYKELYLKMFRATEKAMRILAAAQRECEELYCKEQPETEKQDISRKAEAE